MSYLIKSIPNDVCNLTLTQPVKDESELKHTLKIMQKTAALVLGTEPTWSKAQITKDVDVYTMPLGPGRMNILYVIKE